MAAMVMAAAMSAAQSQWNLSRSEVPSWGGPVVIEGTKAVAEGDPQASLTTPAGDKKNLRVFVTAQIEGSQSWESRVVLPANTTGSPQVYRFNTGGEEKTVTVAPAGQRGDSSGVKVTYYTEADFRFPAAIRNEPVPFLDGIEGLPVGLEKRPFSAKWEGSLVAAFDGQTKFELRCNQNSRIYVDGRKKGTVISKGQDSSAEFTLDLRAGQRVSVLIEMAARQNPVRMQLMWSQNGSPMTLVPQSQFESPDRGTAAPRLKVTGDMSERIVQGAAPAVGSNVAASSPYGEAYAWTELHNSGGLVERFAAGMPITLPPSVANYRQSLRLKYVAVDAAGVFVVQQGPWVHVDPVRQAVPAPAPVRGSTSRGGRTVRNLPTGSEKSKGLKSNSGGRATFEPLAREIAKRYELDPDIFCRMIEVESDWNPNSVSGAGAQGLGQLMPGTAAMLGVSDPFDPGQNMDGAARYLAAQYKRFGSYRLALAAYNAGPGRVARAGGVPAIPETQNYVRKILGS